MIEKSRKLLRKQRDNTERNNILHFKILNQRFLHICSGKNQSNIENRGDIKEINHIRYQIIYYQRVEKNYQRKDRKTKRKEENNEENKKKKSKINKNKQNKEKLKKEEKNKKKKEK